MSWLKQELGWHRRHTILLLRNVPGNLCRLRGYFSPKRIAAASQFLLHLSHGDMLIFIIVMAVLWTQITHFCLQITEFSESFCIFYFKVLLTTLHWYSDAWFIWLQRSHVEGWQQENTSLSYAKVISDIVPRLIN